jgi:hypothetical protein
MIKHAFIQYPYAEPGDFAELELRHDAVIVTQDPQPALAFYRDSLVGFLPNEGPWPDRAPWIGRSSTEDGQLREFYNRLGIRNFHSEKEFWGKYMDEMTNPRVLLDIVARQAMESMEEL